MSLPGRHFLLVSFLLCHLCLPVYAGSPATLDRIVQAIEQAGAKWRAAETPVSALSADDFRRRLGALIPDSESAAEMPTDALIQSGDFPTTFDWRSNDGNWLTPAKDQGTCGNCWAFSVVGALEALYKIRSRDPNVEIDLSEQFLISCTEGSCEGWYTNLACQFLHETGLPHESCFEYMASDNRSCSEACPDWNERAHKIATWRWITSDSVNIDQIKAAVLENPLPCYMTVYSDFAFYQSGVYEHVFGNRSGYHAVVIVGWEDNPPEGGSSCWIVKNSWGTDWGENGYFKIRRDACDIGTWCIDMDIAGADAQIDVFPPAFDLRAFRGQTFTEQLAIFNQGFASLTYNIYVDLNAPSPTTDDAVADSKLYLYNPDISKPTITLPVSQSFAGDPKSRSQLKQNWIPLPAFGSAVDARFLAEYFEGGIMPPTGWLKIDGNSQPGNYPAHWFIDSTYAYEGFYAGCCRWGYNLDEWLISPELDFSAAVAPKLTFFWESSYYWNVSPYNNGDLFVKISTDGGTTWSELWTFGDIGFWENWVWYRTEIDLAAYTGQKIKLAFHVKADDNADIAIDAVTITDASWVDVSPPAGIILPGDSAQVAVQFMTHFADHYLTEGMHAAKLAIASNDATNPLIEVPIRLDVLAEQYAMALSCSKMSRVGLPGDTVSCRFNVTNLGFYEDNYQFAASGNQWLASVWDNAGAAKLIESGTIESGASADFIARVEIPPSAPIGFSDTLTIRARSVSVDSVSGSVKVVVTAGKSLPWFDLFPNPIIDASKWIVMSGQPRISWEAPEKPSEPFALCLKGGDTIDEIATTEIDLSGKDDLELSFYLLEDSEDVSGELLLKYFDGSNWKNLKVFHSGSSTNAYAAQLVDLPPDAHHDAFRIKFSVNSLSSESAWFIDDIFIGHAGDLQAATDPVTLQFSLELGGETTAAMMLKNDAEIPLEFQISLNDSIFTQQNFSANPDWLSYQPRSGYLYPDSTAIVNLTVSSFDLQADTEYFRELLVQTNLKQEITRIPVKLYAQMADYYFTVSPGDHHATGIVEDTLKFYQTIFNHGRRTDTYQLTLTENQWIGALWDSLGTAALSQVGPIEPEQSVTVLITVAIPSDSKFMDSDTAKIAIRSAGRANLGREIKLCCTSLGNPPCLPWSESFPTNRLDSLKWISNTGATQVTESNLNVPSPPYVLNLNNNTPQGDELRTQVIDLSGEAHPVLSFNFQRRGPGDSPEPGDDLQIDFRTASGEWESIMNLPGRGADMKRFLRVEVFLPAEACHSRAQLRLRTSGSALPNDLDDWFIDDIALTSAPEISISAQSLNYIVPPGDNSAQWLEVRNTGGGVLNVAASATNSVSDDLATEKFESDHQRLHNAAGIDSLALLGDNRSHYPASAFQILNGKTHILAWVKYADYENEYTNLLNALAQRYTDFSLFETLTEDTTELKNALGGKHVFLIPEQENATKAMMQILGTTWRRVLDEFVQNGGIILVCDAYGTAHSVLTGANLMAIRENYSVYDFELKVTQTGHPLVNQLPLNFVGAGSMDTFSIDDAISVVEMVLYSETVVAAKDIGRGHIVLIGMDYSNYNDHTARLLANAVQWAPRVEWLSIEPAYGTISPDSSLNIRVRVDASKIIQENFADARIQIVSNDPLTPLKSIDVMVNIMQSSSIHGQILSDSGKRIPYPVIEAWDDYPQGNLVFSVTGDSLGVYELTLYENIRYDLRVFADGFFPEIKSGIQALSQEMNFALRAMPAIQPTSVWMSVYGIESRFDGAPLRRGDVVLALDPDGVACGVCQVMQDGYYGIMAIYSDDLLTSDIDEGAIQGDSIRFEINAYSAFPSGPDSPIWDAAYSVKQIELSATLLPVRTFCLARGWNLVSWNVDTANDSVHIVFADILRSTKIITGYENGASFYSPALPDELNTLHLADHTHGYWLNLLRPDTLSVSGIKVSAQTPIPLNKGWNLVSYLPVQADSLSHALQSISDNLLLIQTFEGGALTYSPALPAFSTLKVMKPGLGYWLKCATADTLVYPETQQSVQKLARSVVGEGVYQMQVDLSSTHWMLLYGEKLACNGELIPPGTIVSAVDANGALCGQWQVAVAGRVGLMPVYGDDPLTEADEGLQPGEAFMLAFDGVAIPGSLIWESDAALIDLGEILAAASDNAEVLSGRFAISQNYPNPFNPETCIKYQVPRDCFVTISVYNTLGQQIRSLVAENKKAGFYSITWDGANTVGQSVASGVYMYRIQAADFLEIRKMILMR
ncbi:choice-of-anchor J domain-containing protein [candidate division KSB1 bacterium]|nr:choice-of-anchor J domain-containing protein [candidate division KSB1 bacterium]